MTTKKATEAKDNGTPPAIELSPQFTPEELNLIHSMLTQVNFQESQAKIMAGQLQMKIERFVGQ